MASDAKRNERTGFSIEGFILFDKCRLLLELSSTNPNNPEILKEALKLKAFKETIGKTVVTASYKTVVRCRAHGMEECKPCKETFDPRWTYSGEMTYETRFEFN